MLRQVERMLAASQDEAVALTREVQRRQWLLEALRIVIEARPDLAKAGYALVPLEPTEAMITAGCRETLFSDDVSEPSSDIADVWRAMVAASGEPNGEASDG